MPYTMKLTDLIYDSVKNLQMLIIRTSFVDAKYRNIWGLIGLQTVYFDR